MPCICWLHNTSNEWHLVAGHTHHSVTGAHEFGWPGQEERLEWLSNLYEICICDEQVSANLIDCSSFLLAPLTVKSKVTGPKQTKETCQTGTLRKEAPSACHFFPAQKHQRGKGILQHKKRQTPVLEMFNPRVKDVPKGAQILITHNLFCVNHITVGRAAPS